MDVIIIGAGGHARVVASTLVAAGHSLAGFYDDSPAMWGKQMLGAPVIGHTNEAVTSRVRQAIVAVGDNRIRQRLAADLGLDWISVVHPFSWVHPDVPVGPGTVVCAGAVIQPGARIGAHVIVNTSTTVDHDAEIGDYVHLAAATVAGGAVAEEGAFIGIGSAILPRVRVGAWATVGAGSTVAVDVLPGSTVISLPARRTISREQP